MLVITVRSREISRVPQARPGVQATVNRTALAGPAGPASLRLGSWPGCSLSVTVTAGAQTRTQISLNTALSVPAGSLSTGGAQIRTIPGPAARVPSLGTRVPSLGNAIFVKSHFKK